nr:hypothetical protein [Tanacetum cinerariifolium]
MQTQTFNTLHNAIMEAGSKDCPPMLAPGNYVQWKSRINKYIDTKPNHELIYYCLTNPPYELEWQRFVTLVKHNQELKTVLYYKLYDILKWHQHEVNEIRAERIARVANPLALIAQQQPVYHPQTHPTHYTHNSSTRSQQTATRNRGKTIVNSPQPISDQKPSMVTEDDETNLGFNVIIARNLGMLRGNVINHRGQRMQPITGKRCCCHEVNEIRAKRIARVANPLALIAQQQPVYHPQTHPTHYTHNSSTRSQQTATMNRGKTIVNSPQPISDQKPSMKPKRAKDAAYHRENMLLCKQEEAGIQLNTEQADWRDDTDDDELKDQELEAHY